MAEIAGINELIRQIGQPGGGKHSGITKFLDASIMKKALADARRQKQIEASAESERNRKSRKIEQDRAFQQKIKSEALASGTGRIVEKTAQFPGEVRGRNEAGELQTVPGPTLNLPTGEFDIKVLSSKSLAKPWKKSGITKAARNKLLGAIRNKQIKDTRVPGFIKQNATRQDAIIMLESSGYINWKDDSEITAALDKFFGTESTISDVVDDILDPTEENFE